MTPAAPEGSGESIEQLSLVDLATARIRDLLITGAIAPGERLREEALTDRLGISRPPLREAMQVLVEKGLLERLPRRGVRAIELTDADIWELYSLRAVLDGFALDLAMPVKDDDLLEPLRNAVEAMRASSGADAVADYVQANRDFHIALVRLSGHRRLVATYEVLMDQMQLSMRINLTRESEADRHAGTLRHEALLTAIESGDAELASAALRAHGETRFLADNHTDKKD